MKFNEESFQKALSECKIIRWQNHFKNVVKAYLKAENEQCNIANVVGQSEQLCDHPRSERTYIGRNMLRCNKCGKEFS